MKWWGLVVVLERWVSPLLYRLIFGLLCVFVLAHNIYVYRYVGNTGVYCALLYIVRSRVEGRHEY